MRTTRCHPLPRRRRDHPIRSPITQRIRFVGIDQGGGPVPPGLRCRPRHPFLRDCRGGRVDAGRLLAGESRAELPRGGQPLAPRQRRPYHRDDRLHATRTRAAGPGGRTGSVTRRRRGKARAVVLRVALGARRSALSPRCTAPVSPPPWRWPPPALRSRLRSRMARRLHANDRPSMVDFVRWCRRIWQTSRGNCWGGCGASACRFQR